MSKKTKKVKKAQTTVMIEITHECGHVLGAFGAADDHGSVDIHCPKCKKIIEVHNSPLGEVMDDFDLDAEDQEYDHSKPIEMNDCLWKVVQVQMKNR